MSTDVRPPGPRPQAPPAPDPSVRPRVRGTEMTTPEPRGPILTLEPLIEAVRDGVEGAGWELSGLQKTTSQQFEGRWQGESTRSAYLFFHDPEGWESVSIDVYLDETSRGLKGNLALVVDGPELSLLGDPGACLATLGEAVDERLPEGYRTPVTLRMRLPDRAGDTADVDLEFRFKIRIPPTAVEAGPSAVSALASTAVGSFTALLRDSRVRRYVVL